MHQHTIDYTSIDVEGHVAPYEVITLSMVQGRLKALSDEEKYKASNKLHSILQNNANFNIVSVLDVILKSSCKNPAIQYST